MADTRPPLPTIDELTPHIDPRAWAQGLTALTLQRIVALRRLDVNFLTIALGGMNLPVDLIRRTYNKLPAHLR